MSIRLLPRLLATVALLVNVFCVEPAAASANPDACATLADVDFSQVFDAPTRIMKTTSASSSGAVGYCEVDGYVQPNVGFLLRLPSRDHWNGKLMQLGCGGSCGTTEHIQGCASALRRGYACIVTDGGHKSTIGDFIWAYNNLQAEVDFAYRAVHVTTLAGKAIVERYYANAPRKSYFMGCSTGGRQAMMEAQRFPWDFDGIIAGSPSLSVPEIYMARLWGNRVLTDNGKPLFQQSDLDFLHKAVVAKCDMNDGLEDGLIGDPRDCDFDPGELSCEAGSSRACLTPRQIDGVRKVYSGPVTSKGEPIFTPTALKGSEWTWYAPFIPSPPEVNANRWRDAFRYSAFDPDPGPVWNHQDFDFDRDYKRLAMASTLYSATNPDLRAFKAAGGKLIAYTGWSDYAMPLGIVDYYEKAEKMMGGRAATQDFFRLFVQPGMKHCMWGDGAYATDYLSYLEAWVERGEPPDKLISAHIKLDDLRLDLDNGAGRRDASPEQVSRDWQEALRRATKFPLDPATIGFTRPVYPYPTKVRYLGRGDPNDAASFGPVEPDER